MTGWLVPLIAAFAALIAYLQWVTAHQKIVLELFDKRLEAFRAIQEGLSPVMRNATTTQQEFTAFVMAVERCRFLFGNDVSTYLRGLRSKMAFMTTYTDATIDQREEPERSRLIDKKYEYLTDLASFESHGVPLFEPYLTLDQRMRYFWPTAEAAGGLFWWPRELSRRTRQREKG
ncbi:hypothetical protein [Bradyrhizobium oligotrophicum]|uniref:hypothetical protein n=1 Tax=Bradyrhizobium oligotrophicum TaxID=44255 RepID=UPI003EBE92E8